MVEAPSAAVNPSRGIWHSSPRPESVFHATRLWALVVALIAFLSGIAYYWVADPPVTGDEPHYMVYARSLGEGWGLDLSRAYMSENYDSFYEGDLEPHARYFAGQDGRFATWHGIALPLLLFPALEVDASNWAARFVMFIMYALLAYHLFRLVMQVTRASPLPAAAGVLILALTPPLIVYSGQVFPEIPGALLVVLAFRALLSERANLARLGGASLAASLLPWFNTRYITLTLALLLATSVIAVRSSTTPRSIVVALFPVAVPALVLGGLLIAFNVEVYGRLAPALQVLPAGYNFQARYLYVWGIGGIIGAPNGLVPHAPVLFLALVALPVTAGVIGPSRVMAALLVALPYTAFNAFFGSPGFAPPGRFFLSVVPLLAVPIALVAAWGGRISILILVALTIVTGVSTVTGMQHFAILYTNGTRGIQPLDVLKGLFPLAIQDSRTSSLRMRPRHIPHVVGRIENNDGIKMIVARSPRDPAGTLAYGPYRTLRPGRYLASFTLWATEGPRTGASLDVVEVEDHILAARDVQSLRSGLTTIKVPFTTAGELTLQLRVFFTRGVLGVSSIDVEQIRALPTREVGDEVWKALIWISLGVACSLLWRRYWRARAPGSGQPDLAVDPVK